ncbi:MAG: hypothetical protein ISS76_09590 [Phycisphaerae bacterium]|nr:hypothetical protein [Phycisphaerae bacterium]
MEDKHPPHTSDSALSWLGYTCRLLVLALVLSVPFAASGAETGEVVFHGRMLAPQYPGSSENVPMSAVYCFGSAAGPDRQAVAFRTWETHPAGWYQLPGPEGKYTFLFSAPAGFVRPIIIANRKMKAGDNVNQDIVPNFDYAEFYQGAWDEKPATDYFQTFVAKGTSITRVGFKLATDGVDGPGPLGQNMLLSIHKKTDSTPEKWPQVGPAATVLNVDCGGAKNYWWCAGWDSGQVPTKPGNVYAVHLKAETHTASLQAFWRKAQKGQSDCFRVGKAGELSWEGRRLCMAVSSGCDGLVVPYNKCIQKKFVEFAGFEKSWSQTYVAQGKGLAGVILYAATSGVQPSIMKQRVKVSIRRGGPGLAPGAGEIVGVEKIAIGNGNYTGDASWGVFGAAFAPGEVPLEPGKTYAVEFESIENYDTLHGFVNIKGQVSDDKPGFNPYRKVPPDNYEHGTAYRKCTDKRPFDLDMQIVEYRSDAEN